MSRRYGRFVDLRIIQRRMNEKDARREQELRQREAQRVASVVAPSDRSVPTDPPYDDGEGDS